MRSLIAILLVCASLNGTAWAQQAQPAAARVSWENFQDITNAAYTFASALDHQDWTKMRTVFADKVDVDTTGANNGTGKATITAETFIWRVKVTETGFDGTQLLMGNPQVEVNGDRARLVVGFYGEHVAAVVSGDNFYTIGGYQTFELHRTNGRWLIDGFRLSPMWTKGNRDIMTIGVRRGLERLTQRGDPPPAEIAAAMKW